MSASDATFSIQTYKTNVLTWNVHGIVDESPVFWTNSEIYKQTKIEEIWRLFNITQKLVVEHSEEIPNVICLECLFITVLRGSASANDKWSSGRRQKVVRYTNILGAPIPDLLNEDGKLIGETRVGR